MSIGGNNDYSQIIMINNKENAKMTVENNNKDLF